MERQPLRSEPLPLMTYFGEYRPTTSRHLAAVLWLEGRMTEEERRIFHKLWLGTAQLQVVEVEPE